MKIVKIDKFSSEPAQLHIASIPTGFISSLGAGFVEALYEAIAEDKNSFGFAAVDDGEVIGFVAFTGNLSKLYKHVIVKKFFKIMPILAGRMFSLKTIKKIFENIFYPAKTKKMDLPSAEVLSIAVAKSGRTKGIGSQLIKSGLEECKKRGIDKVKVLVSADNKPANNLYQKSGFNLTFQIESHGIPSNIYITDLTAK